MCRPDRCPPPRAGLLLRALIPGNPQVRTRSGAVSAAPWHRAARWRLQAAASAPGVMRVSCAAAEPTRYGALGYLEGTAAVPMARSDAGAGCRWEGNPQQQLEKELVTVLPFACTVLSGTGLSLPCR